MLLSGNEFPHGVTDPLFIMSAVTPLINDSQCVTLLLYRDFYVTHNCTTNPTIPSLPSCTVLYPTGSEISRFKTAKTWRRKINIEKKNSIFLSERHVDSIKQIKKIFIYTLSPGFHMSEKSQTFEDFAVSRPSQILPTYINTTPRSSGMVGDKSGKSGAFLFSRRVPGFCNDLQFSRHIGKICDGRETAESSIVWDFSNI